MLCRRASARARARARARVAAGADDAWCTASSCATTPCASASSFLCAGESRTGVPGCGRGGRRRRPGTAAARAHVDALRAALARRARRRSARGTARRGAGGRGRRVQPVVDGGIGDLVHGLVRGDGRRPLVELLAPAVPRRSGEVVWVDRRHGAAGPSWIATAIRVDAEHEPRGLADPRLRVRVEHGVLALQAEANVEASVGQRHDAVGRVRLRALAGGGGGGAQRAVGAHEAAGVRIVVALHVALLLQRGVALLPLDVHVGSVHNPPDGRRTRPCADFVGGTRAAV